MLTLIRSLPCTREPGSRTVHAPTCLAARSPTRRELCAEARPLPREQAAELMDLGLIGTFSAPDPAVEKAWGREIDRRPVERESGQRERIPGEQVRAEVRKLVGR